MEDYLNKSTRYTIKLCLCRILIMGKWEIREQVLVFGMQYAEYWRLGKISDLLYAPYYKI